MIVVQVEWEDFILFQPLQNLWRKERGSEHIFANNVMSFALEILKIKYDISYIAPIKNNLTHFQLNSFGQLKIVYDIISQILVLLGYSKYMPLTGKLLETTKNNFEAGIRTYIQECCPDNKQYHICGKKYCGGGVRNIQSSNLFRPNLFSSPDNWKWFLEDATRWLPCVKTDLPFIPKRSPNFVRYLTPATHLHTTLPLNLQSLVIFYNKPAHLGKKSRPRY